jgi:hypothetical protein
VEGCPCAFLEPEVDAGPDQVGAEAASHRAEIVDPRLHAGARADALNPSFTASQFWGLHAALVGRGDVLMLLMRGRPRREFAQITGAQPVTPR